MTGERVEIIARARERLPSAAPRQAAGWPTSTDRHQPSRFGYRVPAASSCGNVPTDEPLAFSPISPVGWLAQAVIHAHGQPPNQVPQRRPVAIALAAPAKVTALMRFSRSDQHDWRFEVLDSWLERNGVAGGSSMSSTLAVLGT